MKDEKKSFTQETLEKIRSGEKSETSEKKKKLSRIILFIDIIIIVAILIFFNQSNSNNPYYSTSLTYGGLHYRFSLTKDNRSGNYIVSLTIKSNIEKQKKEKYIKSIADLSILHSERIIYRTSIGDNVETITLLPGELKNFAKEIDGIHFIALSNDHPEYIIPREKTLLMAEKRHIPLHVEFSINTKEKISTTLNFKYEVNE